MFRVRRTIDSDNALRWFASTAIALSIAMFGVTAEIGAKTYIVRDVLRVAEESDHWVRVRILEKRDLPSDFDRSLNPDLQRVSLRLAVIDSFPPISADSIELEDYFFRGDVAHFAEYSEWILGLNTWRMIDGSLHYEPLCEIYRIDGGENTVDLYLSVTFPSEETWRLMVDVKRAVDEGWVSDPETIDYWRQQLSSGHAAHNLLAVMFFASLVQPPPIGKEIVEAMVRQDRSLKEGPSDEEKHLVAILLYRGLEVLEAVADRETAELLLSYYLEAIEKRYNFFRGPNIERMPRILASAGASRKQLLEDFLQRQRQDPSLHYSESVLANAYESLSWFEGEDIDDLLLTAYRHELEQPDERTPRILRSLLGALARRGGQTIRKDLDYYFKNSFTSKLGVAGVTDDSAEWARSTLLDHLSHAERMAALTERLIEGDYEVLSTIHRYLTPEDTHLVPILSQLKVEDLEEHYSLDSFASDVADFFPDPVFLPVLREIARSEPRGEVFEALSKCGDPELAKTLALRAFRSGDKQAKRRELVLFLGDAGDVSLLPELDRFAREYEAPENLRPEVVRAAAVMAIGKIGGVEAVARLKAFYNQPDIRIRFTAAVGLYYQKDETGKELMDLFRGHNELRHPEILARWNYDFVHDGSLPKLVEYFRAPHMDRLLIDRIKLRVGSMDTSLEYNQAFITQYKEEVLSACVKHLLNCDYRVRGPAHAVLKQYTKRDFAYSRSDIPAIRKRAQERWARFVRQLLSG